MKFLLSVILLVCAHSAYAGDFLCSKKVSETRTEGANISSFPHLLVGTGYSECTSSGPVGQCSGGSLDEIASDYSVCFQKVDLNSDCTAKESATALEVACRNGYTMTFSMDANSNGKISCLQNGVARKVWDVGFCVIK